MKWKKWAFILFVVCIFSTEMSMADDKKTDDKPIAVADSFTLTQKDADEIRAYYDKGAFRTTEKEYRKVALRIRLFAEEAVALGLDKLSPDKKGDDVFKERMRLAGVYSTKLMEEYPVNDLVIESYYYAHPERLKKSVGDTEIMPLNDVVKKDIRLIVLKAKAKTIQDADIERLKKKYHVRLCEGENGECE
jgi:hypothetical protein